MSANLKLEHTSLPLWQVIVLCALTAVGTAMLIRRRISRAAIKKLLLLSSAVLVGTCVALGLIDLELLKRATEENNVVESLTTLCLLAATCVAFGAAIRLHRQGRPSPTAMTLATGFAWAFSRELEYGGNLLDGQFWFTRNLFHVESFLKVSYFEHFKRQMRLGYDAVPLYVVHLCFTVLAAVILALLVRYVVRYRARAKLELRNFLRTFYCRVYLLGVGLYIGAEIVGGALHRLPQWRVFQGFTALHRGIFHSIVEETMECWGAMAIWFCAAALWQTTRQPDGGPGIADDIPAWRDSC